MSTYQILSDIIPKATLYFHEQLYIYIFFLPQNLLHIQFKTTKVDYKLRELVRNTFWLIKKIPTLRILIYIFGLPMTPKVEKNILK